MLRRLSQLKWRIETLAMLGIARFLVKFVPLKRWRSLLGPIEQSRSDPAKMSVEPMVQDKAIHVGRTVRNIAKKAPFEAACLPQAMAGRWMLRRRGIPSQLFIGAKKEDETDAVKLHAWLMFGEICLTGDQERSGFVPFGN